jgi:hypothetical protein
VNSSGFLQQNHQLTNPFNPSQLQSTHPQLVAAAAAAAANQQTGTTTYHSLNTLLPSNGSSSINGNVTPNSHHGAPSSGPVMFPFLPNLNEDVSLTLF